MEDLKISAGDFTYERQGKLRDTYKIGQKVGDGAFSSVRVIKHRQTRQKRAVKTIHKKSITSVEQRNMVFTQVQLLRQLDHPGIIRLFQFSQDDKNYYIISEFCQGGELFDRIINSGSFSESQAADYMQQILQVIAYLHQRNIVHRDMKPENLLMSSIGDDAHIKVIDFGSSQTFTPGQQMNKKLGTPYYIAPEVLERCYTHTCDIWSVGVIMYILLCGYPPFSGSTDAEIMAKVRAGRFSYPSPEWDEISFEAKDLIEKMICMDANSRISARDALQHPWLSHASKIPINRQIASKILNNMKNFRAEQKLKKATLMFISTQLATKDQREEMLQIFKQLDADMSGTLSKDELKKGFQLIFGDQYENIDEEVDRIMNNVDVDRSGEIDYSEFVAATLSRQQLLSRERLESAFKMFDLDNSGTITADELKEVLGKYHHHDDSFWNDIIREADANGDGVIDLQEFLRMMLREN